MSTINKHITLNKLWLEARSLKLAAIPVLTARSSKLAPISRLAFFSRLAACSLLLVAFSTRASGQKADALIRSGNRYYKKKQIDQSQKEYQEAVRQDPDNPAANYNLGNSQYRKNSYEDAARSYEAGAEHSADSGFKEKSLYNKGVAMVKGQKLQESIDAWKNALKIDPSDVEARENLQKALLELKQQQQQKDQKDKKDQKEKKDQKDQKKQEQPKPQPSKLTKQQVEQLLKALQQKENDVQEKMNQNKAKALTQPDKDW